VIREQYRELQPHPAALVRPAIALMDAAIEGAPGGQRWRHRGYRRGDPRTGGLHRMISHRLDTALREAIQAHADRNRQGMQDLNEILTALAEVAATYLTDVSSSTETRRLFQIFGNRTIIALDAKIRGSGRSTFEH
jgi:hypothetical protein